MTIVLRVGPTCSDDPIIDVDDFQVHFRTDLYHALMQMRNGSEHLYLWIDALCVDQTNTEEKNHQEKFMKNIFKDAQNVIV